MDWSLYVHVPYCRIRCPYCAFVVARDPGPATHDALIDALLADVAAQRAHFPEGPPRTIHLGGGTPSRLRPAALTRLLDGLGAAGVAEVGVEANPEDLDEAWLDAALDAGVTRVSLGVQTLHEGHARRLGRAHTPRDARDALALIAAAGPRLRSWSADLMFGLPGQTLAEVDADVDALLAHDLPHVSVYGLTVEPGTAFERAEARGQLQVADDDAWHAQLQHLHGRLRDAGLRRYEISNHARPGHESVHNLGYWTDRPYLGAGPGAHGCRPDGVRTAHTAPVSAWERGSPPEPELTRPSPEEAAADWLVGGLRAIDGVRRDGLRRFGQRIPADVIDGLVRAGLLADDAQRLRLTEAAVPVADGVTRRLVHALRPVDPRREGG